MSQNLLSNSLKNQLSPRERFRWFQDNADLFPTGKQTQDGIIDFLGKNDTGYAISRASFGRFLDGKRLKQQTVDSFRVPLVDYVANLREQPSSEFVEFIRQCVAYLIGEDIERPPRFVDWREKRKASVAPEGTTEAADSTSSQPDDWNPPWPCVDHRPLLQRISTAQDLLEEASTGVDPWPLIERAGGIIDICLAKMVKTKLEYDPSFYDQVETALWNFADHAELLCRKLTKIDTEKRYFDFTKQVQWIGDKHQQLLPGHDSPNVFVGSSQLRHRLKRFAPLAVISFQWEDRLSGKR